MTDSPRSTEQEMRDVLAELVRLFDEMGEITAREHELAQSGNYNAARIVAEREVRTRWRANVSASILALERARELLARSERTSEESEIARLREEVTRLRGFPLVEKPPLGPSVPSVSSTQGCKKVGHIWCDCDPVEQTSATPQQEMCMCGASFDGVGTTTESHSKDGCVSFAARNSRDAIGPDAREETLTTCDGWSISFNAFSHGVSWREKLSESPTDDDVIAEGERYATEIFPHEVCDSGERFNHTTTPAESKGKV